jgi:hypothetical protein
MNSSPMKTYRTYTAMTAAIIGARGADERAR